MELYECGMLGMKENDWIACSLEALEWINTAFLNLPYDGNPQLSSVEIKTSVASSSVDRSL